ncbi:MAG: hypothetical protein LBP37_01955 [Spirochaetaceae bacterium]|jgi:hypothetical protein|nr:hypothetical protein [Spirochaetaceae bacterium]
MYRHWKTDTGNGGHNPRRQDEEKRFRGQGTIIKDRFCEKGHYIGGTDEAVQKAATNGQGVF